MLTRYEYVPILPIVLVTQKKLNISHIRFELPYYCRCQNKISFEPPFVIRIIGFVIIQIEIQGI